MYNFSGIIFRIWGVCGVILLLGSLIILFEKPWSADFSFKKCKIGLVLIVFSLVLCIIYASRIAFPDISSYSGNYIESQRNSRVAPPLPVTYEYVFWNGTGKRQVFYLDIFSKNSWFEWEFVPNQTYVVYYDTFTKVILRIERLE